MNSKPATATPFERLSASARNRAALVRSIFPLRPHVRPDEALHEVGRNTAKTIPGARLVEIANSGHFQEGCQITAGNLDIP